MVEVSQPNDTPADLSDMRERVRGMVTAERYQHVQRVTELALEIARSNGFDARELAQVELAAVLHDVARDLPDAELMRLAPPECDVEFEHPLSLHGRAGGALALSWGVTDPVVIGAIEGHVWGVDPTDSVGMALYVADVSEPARGVNDHIRRLALVDLVAAYRLAVATKVAYLESAGKDVHPHTRKSHEALHDAS